MAALRNLLMDKYPEINIKTCQIFKECISQNSFINGKEILKEISNLSSHSRWKVRLAGSQALNKIIIRPECQDLFDDILPIVKTLSNDKNKVKWII